ncbi:MAG: membrane protein insertion efficiency factor YidD [Planctomycetia bacterium]|nr:membrane protein insertion efficiency factor YidD [Planctomycetia bacterium]
MSLTIPLDAASGRLAVAAITGYQRFLSPWKGYVCAHRVWQGGASCSELIKQVIASGGLIAGLRALRPRLLECRGAAHAIREARLARASALAFDEYFDPPIVPEGDSKKRPVGWPLGCGEPACDGIDCLHFLPHGGPHDCLPADLHGCDAPGIDPGGCDLSGADCGGCG